ncbi:MAG: fructose-bisphosphatase class III, partial [Oscillospiraceae bacterium]
EFGLPTDEVHIINGHVPVKTKRGESPIKCGGKVLCIDGGFCKAYQPTTGIAGYTLIYNSYGLRLVSHGPFSTVEEAVRDNTDILSISNIFERVKVRKTVADTDIGVEIREQVEALNQLLLAYRAGELPQREKK